MNYVYYPDYLEHHGIKGQRWGIRRYQNKDGTWTTIGKFRRNKFTNYKSDGGTIKKGSTLYRITTDPSDTTYDNKKYVSTSRLDNKLWRNFFSNYYDSLPKESKETSKYKNLYSLKYTTINDINVASQTKLGEEYVNLLKNTGYNVPDNYDKYMYKLSLLASQEMRNQSENGKQMVNSLLKQNYQAVADTNGDDVAIDPVIILEPEKNIKMTKNKKIK